MHTLKQHGKKKPETPAAPKPEPQLINKKRYNSAPSLQRSTRKLARKEVNYVEEDDTEDDNDENSGNK